ncbi:hypothetical protein DY023_00220 [Microbacterium bovistercoris]|uniref:Uncharacterized protein n=2 Tax=Microbacterium bovistercoris TaxID=2293570 RepID=A0A371NZC6_9MICO|nr:hypothetical protein DY023_00220 [Microbacterium bovistercoris]
MMSTLSLFDEPADDQVPTMRELPMYDSQRREIRELFAALGLTTAPEQFAVVEELISVRLRAVTDLNREDARRLLSRLQSRVQTSRRASTGDSWADRDEDTWIDKL